MLRRSNTGWSWRRKIKTRIKKRRFNSSCKDKLAQHPDISSSELSQYIVNQARNIEIDRKPKDDISACVLYFREPREALIFTGPPYHQQKDKEYAEMFANFKGKKQLPVVQLLILFHAN